MKNRKVAVIGAGVNGLSTAFFLNKAGFDVAVYDSQKSCATKTSFANGGQLSYSHVFSLNCKLDFLARLKYFASKNKYIYFKNPFSIDLSNWCNKYMNHLCSRSEASKELYKMAQKSADLLDEMEDIFLLKSRGIVQFFANQNLFLERKLQIDRIFLDDEFKVLEGDDFYNFDPLLGRNDIENVHGFHFLRDKIANSFEFCTSLQNYLKEKGVSFVYNFNVHNVQNKNRTLTCETIEADYFVFCTGIETKSLLSNIMDTSSLMGIRGYSLTLNGFEYFELDGISLSSGLIDVENKIVYSPFRSSIKVAGLFDFGVSDSDGSIIKLRQDVLLRCAKKTFPFISKKNVVHKWTGVRCATYNFLPMVKQIDGCLNAFVNTGHGPLGFTLAMWSGNQIATFLSDL